MDNKPAPIQRMTSAKRAILIPQKTNIRLDLESLVNAAATNDSRSRRPSLGKTPVVSASVSVDKVPSLSRPASHYIAPVTARTAEDVIADAKINQFLEDAPMIGLTKEDSKILRTRVLEEMYRIQQRQQITPEERQRLYQLAISMDAPKLARKLVAESKEAGEEYSVISHDSANSENGQPVSSFLTGEYNVITSPVRANSKKASSLSPVPSKSQQSQQPPFSSFNQAQQQQQQEDELFCKAFDEVERIRQRMMQRVNTATVATPATATAGTNITPPPVTSARQPLTGRRLSGDGVQNMHHSSGSKGRNSNSNMTNNDPSHQAERRKSLSPIPDNNRTISGSNFPSSSIANSHNHHNMNNAHNRSSHAVKVHPLDSNSINQPHSAVKPHNQMLHDLLTPRTPEHAQQQQQHNNAHSHQQSYHQYQHQYSQSRPSSLLLTPTVDQEPSINVHEALDSILGSHSHSHSRSQSQPNSQSMSGRKKSALSSYYRILAAADAHSDDSPQHTSDEEDNDDNGKSNQFDDYDDDDFEYGSTNKSNRVAAADAEDDSENEEGVAAIAAIQPDDQYGRNNIPSIADNNNNNNNSKTNNSNNSSKNNSLNSKGDKLGQQVTGKTSNSNNSSLDSESRRAVEGLRRYDSHNNLNSTVAKEKEKEKEVEQEVVRPRSAATRLTPLRPVDATQQRETENEDVISTTTTTTRMNTIGSVSTKEAANKRQQRRQQPPPPSASQKIPAGYLISSPLSDWIQLSTGLTPLPALNNNSNNTVTSSNNTDTVENYNNINNNNSSIVTGGLRHQPSAASIWQPHSSLYTPSIQSSEVEQSTAEDPATGGGRHGPLRQSRFTFTPQEMQTSGSNNSNANSVSANAGSSKEEKDAIATVPRQQMMLSSLESLHSSQHPDLHNLKRSLEFLKEHVGAMSPSTPSHISLSGLNTPSYHNNTTTAGNPQQSQPYTMNTRNSSSSTLLLQQSLKRPFSTSLLSPHGFQTHSNNNNNNNTTTNGSHSSLLAAISSTSTSPRPLSSGGGTGNSSAQINNSNTGSTVHPLGRKTSSFRHAGDLLLARNIVDAATSSASSATATSGPLLVSPRSKSHHGGIAQTQNNQNQAQSSPVVLGQQTSFSNHTTNNSNGGMPPLRRDNSLRVSQPLSLVSHTNNVTLSTASTISSSSTASNNMTHANSTSSTVTNTPTPTALSNNSNNTNSSSSNISSNNNHNRMFALAAALDAGDAVGKLMADMMMLGTPPPLASSTTASSLRLTSTPASLR